MKGKHFLKMEKPRQLYNTNCSVYFIFAFTQFLSSCYYEIATLSYLPTVNYVRFNFISMLIFYTFSFIRHLLYSSFYFLFYFKNYFLTITCKFPTGYIEILSLKVFQVYFVNLEKCPGQDISLHQSNFVF